MSASSPGEAPPPEATGRRTGDPEGVEGVEGVEGEVEGPQASREDGAPEGDLPPRLDTDVDAAREENPLGLRRGFVSLFAFWAQGKVCPGLELSLGGQWLHGTLEAALIFVTDSTPSFDGSLLGNQLGAFLEATPLQLPNLELGAGLGADFFLLWGISQNASESALAARILLRLIYDPFSVSVSGRTYLLASEGLELGTSRSGSSGPAVLLTTGLTYRFDL